MRLSKKRIAEGNRKIAQDLFFGRKNFRKFKEMTNTFLQDSSQMWKNLPEPSTKEEREQREIIVGIASLGSIYLKRIREAETYRKSIKFRNCRYKKYIDEKNKITIFACRFFKIVDKLYKTNYFCITNKKNKKGLKAELIKTEIKTPNRSVETGRFRFSPHSFSEFNLFLYPKSGHKYAYTFFGNDNAHLHAQLLNNENEKEDK